MPTRQTKYSTVNSRFSKEDAALVFLCIGAGGSGKIALQSTIEQHQAAGNPFPFFTAAIDTDRRDFDSFDFAIDIAPMREDVSALKKNPERYGTACRVIAEQYPELLNSETLGQGARTHRIITQAAFELFDKRIIEGLQKTIHSLLEIGQFRRVMPVILASLGGGTGSAAIILLQYFFMGSTRKSQIVLGLEPEIVLRPTAFVVDAYAHASKGLSQTVVVKRWGGVISKLVARLKKNPYVTVVDAGQLELRTVTLVPLVKLRSVKWHDASSGLAKVQFDVTVTNRSELTLPDKSAVKISCPLAGCRWLTEPSMIVTGRTQTQTFTLLVELNPKKFNLTKNYSLPLRFHWPSQITTGKSLLVPVVNPIQIYCVLPAGQLRPNVTISAKLSEQGKPRWEDMDECIVVWPMRLRLEIKTAPSFTWSEQVKLNINGLNVVKVVHNGPIILQGRPKEVDISLTKKIPLEQVIQGKPVQAVLSTNAGILASCAYRGNRPQRAVLGSGCIKLAGAFARYAVSNLHFKGFLRGHLCGKGFSKAGADDWISWSMQPTNPAVSSRIWRDVTVTGDLVVLPENAAPGTMVGSVIDVTVTYEALYKTVALYLAVGVVVVLVGTLLFWLARRMIPDINAK